MIPCLSIKTNSFRGTFIIADWHEWSVRCGGQNALLRRRSLELDRYIDGCSIFFGAYSGSRLSWKSGVNMFDWARGEMMRKLVQAGIHRAAYDRDSGVWLKSWSIPWFLGAVELHPGLRILDVGSGTPRTAQYLATTFGCTMEALDGPSEDAVVPEFGMSRNVSAEYPNVKIHVGLAGQDTLPAEYYDIVYCNSVIEHTYDRREALDPVQPLAHLDVLRDLTRMLRPGGLLMLNWDTYASGIPHQIGWEFEADIWLLQSCGMRLADPRRRVRSARYIYDHPDTLFFAPEVVMPFAAPVLPRAISVNAIFVKPGGKPSAALMPDPVLRMAYLPEGELASIDEIADGELMDSAAIERNFREHIGHVNSAFAGQIFD